MFENILLLVSGPRRARRRRPEERGLQGDDRRDNGRGLAGGGSRLLCLQYVFAINSHTHNSHHTLRVRPTSRVWNQHWVGGA